MNNKDTGNLTNLQNRQITNKNNIVTPLPSKHYRPIESIIIKNDRNESIGYDQKKYNTILDLHPEFMAEKAVNPDLSYQQHYDFKNFGSESGQDQYYILYSHFLKQKNGVEKLEEERHQLIELYTAINALYWKLEDGGTHFGHQYYRILGYVEFDLYVKLQDENKYKNEQSIQKTKEHYIKSLRQLIKTKTAIEDQKNLNKLTNLNQKVDSIAQLITNPFYLSQAKKFQNAHYK